MFQGAEVLRQEGRNQERIWGRVFQAEGTGSSFSDKDITVEGEREIQGKGPHYGLVGTHSKDHGLWPCPLVSAEDSGLSQQDKLVRGQEAIAVVQP